MANPQQPELRRSETTPTLTPDAIESELEAERQSVPGEDPSLADDRRPPADGEQADQDKPDLDAVAEQLGTVDDS